MTVRSYLITATGANHSRKEYEDGEPVVLGKRDKDKPVAYRMYKEGDVIRMDDADAKKPSYRHLKLVLHVGGSKSTKPAAEPTNSVVDVELPEGWRDLSKQKVIALGKEVSGEERLTYDAAFEVLEKYEEQKAAEEDAGVINE